MGRPSADKAKRRLARKKEKEIRENRKGDIVSVQLPPAVRRGVGPLSQLVIDLKGSGAFRANPRGASVTWLDRVDTHLLESLGARGDDTDVPHDRDEGADMLLAALMLYEVETGRKRVEEEDVRLFANIVLDAIRFEFGRRNGLFERRGESLFTPNEARMVAWKSAGEAVWKALFGTTAVDAFGHAQ
ncbi:MAG: hypothetical protein Q8P41_02365 [Pseudomonadota bacterium]|nr:hypothetical protein [Pseudomonadota bacterium]